MEKVRLHFVFLDSSMSTQRLTKQKSDTIVFHHECVSITEKAMCTSSAFVILINGYGLPTGLCLQRDCRPCSFFILIDMVCIKSVASCRESTDLVLGRPVIILTRTVMQIYKNIAD